MLEAEGKVPFSGEIIFGCGNINDSSLSTVWIGYLENALSYTKIVKWTPEDGNKNIDDAFEFLEKRVQEEDIPDENIKQVFTTAFRTRDLKAIREDKHAGLLLSASINGIEVEQKRMALWDTLNDCEQKLISDPFPVLYGIKSERRNAHIAVKTAIHGEILLKDGAHSNEIKVIFVPVDRVSFVQDLLAQNGHSDIAVEGSDRLFSEIDVPLETMVSKAGTEWFQRCFGKEIQSVEVRAGKGTVDFVIDFGPLAESQVNSLLSRVKMFLTSKLQENFGYSKPFTVSVRNRS